MGSDSGGGGGVGGNASWVSNFFLLFDCGFYVILAC